MTAQRFVAIVYHNNTPHRVVVSETPSFVVIGADVGKRLTASFMGPFVDDAAASEWAAAQHLALLGQPKPAPIIGAAPMRVVCRETSQVFDALTEAARAVGASPANLSRHLQGRSGFRTIKGLTFARFDDLPEQMQAELIEYNATQSPITAPRPQPERRAIVNVSTGTVFHAKRDVCKTFHIAPRQIENVLTKTHLHGMANLWYLDECPSVLLPDHLQRHGKLS